MTPVVAASRASGGFALASLRNQVYHEPSGRKILQSGGPAGRFNEMCTATAVESSGWAWDKDTPAQEWAYLTWQD